jgi:hypothetical protein
MDGDGRLMSGKDERKIQIPQCPTCGRTHDIVIAYFDAKPAGWIIPDHEVERFNVAVILSRNFSRNCTPVTGYCLTCGALKQDEVRDKALKFFKEQMRLGNYLTWDEFSELTKHER